MTPSGRRRRRALRRVARALPIVWYRSPLRRRQPRFGLDRNGLRYVPAGLQPLAHRGASRTLARRVELRSRVRDRRYLERAIRYLAQLLTEDAPRKIRR